MTSIWKPQRNTSKERCSKTQSSSDTMGKEDVSGNVTVFSSFMASNSVSSPLGEDTQV